MITLPDFTRAFEYENDFHLSCEPARFGKFIAHYEIYRRIMHLPGAIVECGVFKGSSLIRFCTFRSLCEASHARKVIGFDVFGPFPPAQDDADREFRERFVNAAGSESIGREQLLEVLRRKGLDSNVELVEGDICSTVPRYTENNPQLKIALLNVDTDNYEPSKIVIEQLFPRLVTGGIMLLDDYGFYPGETRAFDEYFPDPPPLEKLPFSGTPCFLMKG